MNFSNKAYTDKVRNILCQHLGGKDKNLTEATSLIVNLIKEQHLLKLKVKQERDNALIRADRSDVWII